VIGTTASSSSGSSPTSSGAGGGDTATVTGTVAVVGGLAFDTSSAFTKPATLYADGPSGKELAQAYDGSPFTLAGVAKGRTWFLVVPKDTSETVFPTYSEQTVPAASLVLPVIDQPTLTILGLNVGLALSTLAAQIVLRVSDGTRPLAGVSAASAGAGLIVYDLGPGSSSAQTTATGDRGLIVLLNQSMTSIVLTNAKSQPYHLDVRPEQGTATLLDVVLAP
jgi:hypothetical protein